MLEPVPEGDTIYRLAERLRPALVDRRIVDAKIAVAEIRESHVVGSSVVAVSARGKNLLIGLSNGLTLHTHLMMHGAWHLYARGERWRMPSFRLRIALMTEEAEAVCFGAPVVRMLRTDRIDKDPKLSALGPDVLGGAFDANEAARRISQNPDRTIAEALLDQRAVAGIGNVLKSEILFLAKVHPEVAVGLLGEAELAAIFEITSSVMSRAVAPGRARRFALPGRVTRVTSRSQMGRGGELWVYERRGEPCFVCGTPIERITQGEDARSTYFCPKCQPASQETR
ncbi:MAG: Fpg/Nei family DNA glycosylase [Polyangiaceae bacterium]|nr:Fpg/Nei family DNA glycosylase [Polyangiaceae bacterium]